MNLRMIGVIVQLFSIASVATAAPNPLDKCVSIPDAKRRLICYDIASKQLPYDPPAMAAKADEAALQPEVKAEAPPKADRTISFETGLVYRSGDVKPVARTSFYLLNESLVEIFRKADLHPPLELSGDLANYQEVAYQKVVLSSYAKLLPVVDKLPNTTRANKMRDFVQMASNAMTPHILAQTTTDFSGRAKFESLKPGTYYLMGVTQTQRERGAAIWNFKVETLGIDTKIILDQNNAVSVD